jgi:hypothetical protein
MKLPFVEKLDVLRVYLLPSLKVIDIYSPSLLSHVPIIDVSMGGFFSSLDEQLVNPITIVIRQTISHNTFFMFNLFLIYNTFDYFALIVI